MTAEEGTGASVGFTSAQQQRLAEIGLPDGVECGRFSSSAERDARFEELSRELTEAAFDRLDTLRDERRRPEVRSIEAAMVDALTAEGFVEVVTPTIIGKGSLHKLGLDEAHPLWRQIFWVDGRLGSSGKVEGDRCLRPMLAPNLYVLLSHLQRLWPPPVRVFEVGPCFRKESTGSNHLSEFTMLNLVELEPEGHARSRLHGLAFLVMDRLNLGFDIVETESEVYGATMDIEVGGIEVASGVAGPHPMDEAWGIHGAWAGWGFGLERLAMARTGLSRVHPLGRSLSYLDGVRLNIQASATRGARRAAETAGREAGRPRARVSDPPEMGE
jgi:phenylalanyl-tRNA synthetase alpha chain